MNNSLLRFACLAAVLLPAASAVAADLEPPPPIDDLRRSTFDISLGVFGTAVAIEGKYDYCVACDPDMSGIGYGGGVKAGFDYKLDNGFLVGVVGDWAWGGRLAKNEDPAQLTWIDMNDLATLRARAGFSNGGATLYLTGGLAAANMEFGAPVGPANVKDTDAQWTTGWTIGGGIEYAISEAITVDLEYLYVNLSDTDHTLSDGAGSGGTVHMKYDDMHTVRAGVSYKFSL
jgi:outer membrane immunogenic protein